MYATDVLYDMALVNTEAKIKKVAFGLRQEQIGLSGDAA